MSDQTEERREEAMRDLKKAKSFIVYTVGDDGEVSKLTVVASDLHQSHAAAKLIQFVR
jgi:hypothetical protein